MVLIVISLRLSLDMAWPEYPRPILGPQLSSSPFVVSYLQLGLAQMACFYSSFVPAGTEKASKASKRVCSMGCPAFSLFRFTPSTSYFAILIGP